MDTHIEFLKKIKDGLQSDADYLSTTLKDLKSRESEEVDTFCYDLLDSCLKSMKSKIYQIERQINMTLGIDEEG